MVLLTTTTTLLLFLSSPLCHSFTTTNHPIRTVTPQASSVSIGAIRSSFQTRTSFSVRAQTRYSSRGSGSTTTTALCLRRQLLSEDDLAVPPDKNVVDAVEGMGGNMIVASDVAAKAGVSLSTARKSLSALASLTRGDIAVTESGDLLYTFPSGGVKAALASNSLRYRVRSTWDNQIWPKLFYGIRVGFGVSIFVSLLAIFATFVFVSSGGGSSDDDRRDDRRRGGGGGFMMFDMFYPRPLYFSSGRYYGYYGRYDPYRPDARRYRQEEEEEDEEPNFFEKIFSFIFGDGDPNRGMEEARLRGAAEMIRENGGSVVAEQLAPFCDVPGEPEEEDGALVDEGFVLPLVTRLGGEPTVTEDGDIVYLFEELQVSTGAGDVDQGLMRSLRRRREAMRGEISAYENGKMEYLEEKRTEFSRTGTFGRIVAGGLGVVNLGGALYLGQVFSSLAMQGIQLPSFYGLIQGGYPLLLAYAILYNAIPAGRFLYLQKSNSDVDARNSARRRWLTKFKAGGSTVRRKLTAARSMRQKMRRLGGRKDFVYDTSSDIEDVALKKENEDLKKFDELLRDDDNLGSFE